MTRGGVVDTLSAHKPHGAACLVGHHSPAVDFFLVDPTRMVKGLDEHRLEWADFKGSEASHRRPFCQVRQPCQVWRRALSRGRAYFNVPVPAAPIYEVAVYRGPGYSTMMMDSIGVFLR
jgi:hypothetical protein